MPAKLVYTPDEGGQGSVLTLPMAEGVEEAYFDKVADRAGSRFSTRWNNGVQVEYINVDELGAETVVFTKHYVDGGIG